MIGPLGENLIFILSQPRAGSSMLQRVLSGSRDIFTTAEPWIALPPVFALRPGGGHQYESDAALDALRDFFIHLPGGESRYLGAVANFLREIYNAVLEPAGRKMFLDKTPRYYFIIPQLREMFPAAKFIFLRRNPMAVFSSFIDTWGENTITKKECQEDFYTAPGLLLEGSKGPGEVVFYEKLVTDPAGQISRLCKYLGVDYDPAMLEYGTRPRLVGRMQDPKGTSLHAHPVADNVDKWKEKLLPWRRQARSYLSLLDPNVLRGLGYPKESFEGWI